MSDALRHQADDGDLERPFSKERENLQSYSCFPGLETSYSEYSRQMRTQNKVNLFLRRSFMYLLIYKIELRPKKTSRIFIISEKKVVKNEDFVPFIRDFGNCGSS